MDGVVRRWLLGARAAVTLTALVALLSLATGIANIVGLTPLDGPLTDLIPPVLQQATGFTGALTGFLLLLATSGLRRGQRAAWYAAVALLPVAAAQGLLQSSGLSLPLVALSVVSLPAVLLNYGRFDRELALSTAQLGAMTALAGTLVYGTAGSYALRDSFEGLNTLVDALYFTIVTASTVGYGDFTPGSQQARLFGISLVVLGTASFALALGSVLGPAIEKRFSRALGTMSDTEYELLEDHVLVLGYGDLTESLVEELTDVVEFVVVTPDPERTATLNQHGIEALHGDPSDEEPLHDVAIDHARAVIVATDDDADDAFAILTARALNPDVHIVAAATHHENVEKLRRAGADAVLSPAAIGGRLLSRSALDASADAEAVVDSLLGDENGN